MKKLLLMLMAGLISINLFAQTPANTQQFGGFYTRLDLGYTAPHAGNFYNSNAFSSWNICGSESYNMSSGLRTIDYKKGSYSTGGNLGLAAGYMFNEHVGVDLGVRLGLLPKKNTSEYTEQLTGGTVVYTATTYLKTPVYVTPSIVVSTGADRRFSSYFRAGVVFPVGGRAVEEYTIIDNTTGDEYYDEAEYEFYSSKGLTGALGAQYRLNDRLSLYGELSGMSLTRYVKRSELTVATTNGMDDLAGMTTYQKETEYGFNTTLDQGAPDPSMPFQATVISMPASNFGVSVGATLSLGDLDRIKLHNDTATAGDFPGAYVRAGVGYSLPHAGSFYHSEGFAASPLSGSESFNSTISTVTIDYNKTSLSSGLNAVVAGGYMLNPNFGAELGFGVSIAPKSNTFEFSQSDSAGLMITQSTEIRSKTGLYLMPALVVSSGADKPFSIYGRAGLVIPLGGGYTTTQTTTNLMNNTISEIEEDYSFYMSKGLQGALGARLELGEKFGLWGEINGSSLTRYAKSSEVVRYTFDGMDELGTLTTQQRMSEYKFNYTYDPSAANASTPSLRPVQAVPYSNWGLNFGVDLRF